MPFGVSHKPLVALANSCICAFFRQIEVYGEDNVPTEGPIILSVDQSQRTRMADMLVAHAAM